MSSKCLGIAKNLVDLRAFPKTQKLKNTSNHGGEIGQYRDPWHTGEVGIDPTGGEHGGGARRRHSGEGAVGEPCCFERGEKGKTGGMGTTSRTPSVLTLPE